MQTEYVDCIVIGAGVIGLAIGRACAMQGRQVYVFEAEKIIGSGTSSRNSEVIHAGIYYPEDSLKARLCKHGKNKLYQYLKERKIPYKKCGKLIVGTKNTHLESLHKLKENAVANGVDDLEFLSKEKMVALEPTLNCVGSLLSPSTGILDTHSYMLSLSGDIENNGGCIVLSTSVVSIEINNDVIKLYVNSNGDDICLIAKTVINAAGHGAIPLANKMEGLSVDKIPTAIYAKGNYYSYSGKNPFSHLIYPVPEKGGLGVHLTMDLTNRARFGPDVEWLESLDFEVSPDKFEAFYAHIRDYWPGLPDNSLYPDYCGIRPKIKINGHSEIYSDFMIQGPKDHGVSGLVNLFGIESPGITASLAIADYVRDLLEV